MENKEKNFISAVVYVHDSEKEIKKFLTVLKDVFEHNFEHSEIICVNDCSKDSSVSMIREISKEAKSTSIAVVNMSYYHGLEASMNAGMDLAIGDFVYEFDSAVLDFEDSEIMSIYKRSLQGYDIVNASAERKQKFTSNLFYYIFDKFTDISYKMYTESFRVLSRRAINRISSMNKTVPYRKALYANCGLKIDNKKYKPLDTDMDTNFTSKQDRKYRRRLALDSLILFTDFGYSFSVAMTSIMMITTIVMGFYSILVYIQGTPVAGWTTTILFLSFCFLGLFGILTVIIKYMQILLDLIFKKKHYSFESIEKLTK